MPRRRDPLEICALVSFAVALLVGLLPAALVATSPGADYLNAPFAAGTDDGTGFLAWRFTLTATAVGHAPGEDCGDGVVYRPTEVCDDGNTLDGDHCAGDCPTCGSGAGSSCALGGTPGSGPLVWLLVALAVWWLRRRQSKWSVV